MSELNVNLDLLSESAAVSLNKRVPGEPTENRILIAVPNGETKSKGGLYVPSTVQEGVPRKGVVVKIGPVSDGYEIYGKQLKVGSIVTYGLYAGKAISLDLDNPIEGQDFNVLSFNEIIYIEPNNR